MVAPAWSSEANGKEQLTSWQFPGISLAPLRLDYHPWTSPCHQGSHQGNIRSVLGCLLRPRTCEGITAHNMTLCVWENKTKQVIFTLPYFFSLKQNRNPRGFYSEVGHQILVLQGICLNLGGRGCLYSWEMQLEKHTLLNSFQFIAIRSQKYQTNNTTFKCDTRKLK